MSRNIQFWRVRVSVAFYLNRNALIYVFFKRREFLKSDSTFSRLNKVRPDNTGLSPVWLLWIQYIKIISYFPVRLHPIKLNWRAVGQWHSVKQGWRFSKEMFYRLYYYDQIRTRDFWFKMWPPRQCAIKSYAHFKRSSSGYSLTNDMDHLSDFRSWEEGWQQNLDLRRQGHDSSQGGVLRSWLLPGTYLF